MTSDDRRCDSVFGLAVKTPKMVYDALRKFRPSEVSLWRMGQERVPHLRLQS